MKCTKIKITILFIQSNGPLDHYVKYYVLVSCWANPIDNPYTKPTFMASSRQSKWKMNVINGNKYFHV